MTRIKQFALIIAGACMLASCGSKMSEEEMTKKVDDQFNTQLEALTATAEQACQETFAAQVALKADALVAEKADAAAAAIPAPAEAAKK